MAQEERQVLNYLYPAPPFLYLSNPYMSGPSSVSAFCMSISPYIFQTVPTGTQNVVSKSDVLKLVSE
jgi:hypothetical protein